MKYIEYRMYILDEYQADIEEIAEELKDAMMDQSIMKEDGDFPIADVTYEIKDLEQ